MLLRIVRMEFEPSKIEDFKLLFDEVKERITGFDGCSHVELCSDPEIENVYYTFSNWENEAALNGYRNSEFFDDIWKRTKALFSGKPLAYSLIQE